MISVMVLDLTRKVTVNIFFSLLPPAITFLVTHRCPFFVPFVMLYIKGLCTILEEKYRATYALMDVLFLCFLGDVLH